MLTQAAPDICIAHALCATSQHCAAVGHLVVQLGPWERFRARGSVMHRTAQAAASFPFLRPAIDAHAACLAARWWELFF